MKGICFAVLLGSCLVNPYVSSAGETNARDYLPAPSGTSIVLTYAKHITADSLYTDGNKTKGFNYTQNLGFFRYVYFNTLFGMPIDYQALFFFNDQKLDGDAVGNNQFSSSGIMDPAFVSTIWPIANTTTKTWLGFTQYITIPLGEYDGSQVLNPGCNRWAFKEELGFVQGIGDKTFFELQPSVEFYTDNDDYFGETQETDPLFQLQMHLSYNLTPKFWISGDYTYKNGGQTTCVGVTVDEKTESHQFGMSFSYSLTDITQLLLEYTQVVDTENGPDVSVFGARFLYVF